MHTSRCRRSSAWCKSYRRQGRGRSRSTSSVPAPVPIAKILRRSDEQPDRRRHRLGRRYRQQARRRVHRALRHRDGPGLRRRFDVADPAGCRKAVAEILARHGRVDVLCNNAGVGAAGDAVEATAEDWQRVFAVNVYGAAHMTAAVLPAMREAGRGVIVNTCSVAATVGLPDRVVYSASKGALLALTRAVAADEIHHGIRVNAVSPGTRRRPMGAAQRRGGGRRRVVHGRDAPAAAHR
ncbi:MAG: SDR family NAD(P)-dependent oxidoreductase [Streptosporangiales bacterium]|nr:SDR family NAD(P)-dependent oxidoreductase [Streptosporangiales bacterium]